MTEKTEKLGVGLTEEEKKKIRLEAARRDMSMSELARQILLEKLDETGEGNPTRMTPETAD
jgi:plasmid stability protein